MGKLITMPSSNTDQDLPPLPRASSAAPDQPAIDFSVWTRAPRERTAAYFPTYSAVSRAMQTAMREWVREWFTANMEVLQRPHTAYSVLVYQCTHPFAGQPSNTFTYEIQQTDTLNKAFRSAANKLGRYLRSLNIKSLDWFDREKYSAYGSRQVISYVNKNPRAIYRMLHVETMLMDALLRFTLTDLPAIGMEASLFRLRRTFRVQLHRFSEQFDLSPRSEELLRIATDALVAKMASDLYVPVLKVA